MRRRTLPNLKGRGIEAAADPRDALPPGWIRVESRSKPGTYYYAHPATKKTQLERPVDPRFAQREKPKPVLEPKPAPAPAEAVTVEDDVETLEEKQKREEQRKAEQKAREEAEEKEREEVLLRARQRRAQQMLEEEKRRKEEEEQEEEERQRAAERRREKKAEAERLRKEEEKERREQKDDAPKPVALGRRDPAKPEPKWRKKAAESADEDGDEDDEVTLEELERWKASEEQHEREEAEAKRRKIEEEERRKKEAELAEKRKKAEFEEAVARARRMKSESSVQKQEELRRGSREEAAKAEPSKAETPKAEPTAPAPAAEAPDPAKAEPTQAAVPPPQELARPQPPPLPQFQAAPPNMHFPFQIPAMQPQFPRPPAPPPPPPPTPPTLANLLSGAVAKPDFGKLLKQPKPSTDTENAEAPAGPQTGTVLWYNGRRKSGVLLADRDSRQLRIPSNAATMGGVAPPVPAGLMHGTRVNFMLDASTSGDPVCVQLRPLPSQVGLSCGGDSQTGHRVVNEDRTIATDLQESLGHMVGIFDGHRGTFCADYLSQELPKTIVQSVRDVVNQEASRRGVTSGMPWEAFTEAEEVDAIRIGIVAGLEAADRNFLGMAQQYGFKDGASALVAIIMHGFQSSSGTSSVPSAPGGQARLFSAWSGTGHILLLRGRQVLRCTEDHVVNREDERHRLAAMGAHLVQDLRGVWWMGRPGNPELAWARQQCYDDVAGPKTFTAASRGYGDIMLKGPPYPVLVAGPEVQVTDLGPDDWAIVLATRGVFSVLSDQDVANACWDTMAQNGQGPQEAAQIVTQRAMQLGARSNLTCIVMRLGWAKLPS